jgi:hypothetical protein
MPEGMERARLHVRQAGYCVLCNRIVERLEDGGCPVGHPPEAVNGRIVLDDSEPVPSLPRFNVAAFLIPPVWGPAHGQWAGAVFLPIWLFLDSIIASASAGPVAAAVATVAIFATLGFQAIFARRANGMAYRRVWEDTSIDRFLRVQRIWAYAAVPAVLLMIGWAVWFRLVIAPSLVAL